MSLDQMLRTIGFTGPVTDQSLGRTDALPPSSQMGPAGFGTVGLQGSGLPLVPVQLPRPNAPIGVGGMVEATTPIGALSLESCMGKKANLLGRPLHLGMHLPVLWRAHLPLQGALLLWFCIQ